MNRRDLPSLVGLIREAAQKTQRTADIEKAVWEALTPTRRQELGRPRLRQMIIRELKDPTQLEMQFEGELVPVNRVPHELVARRMRRLIPLYEGLGRLIKSLSDELASRRVLET